MERRLFKTDLNILLRPVIGVPVSLCVCISDRHRMRHFKQEHRVLGIGIIKHLTCEFEVMFSVVYAKETAGRELDPFFFEMGAFYTLVMQDT